MLRSRIALVITLTLALLVLAACNKPTGPVVPVQTPLGLPTLPPCPNNYANPPQQVYPAEGNLVLDLQPKFEWTFPLECTPVGFSLRVGTMSDPQSDDVFDGKTGSLLRNFSGVNLLPATWHRWRVYADLVPGASVSNGEFVSFLSGPICGANDLEAPTLFIPEDGAIYPGKSWGNPYEVETVIIYPDGKCVPEAFTIYISQYPDFSDENWNVYSPAGPAMFTSNSAGKIIIQDDSNDVLDCTTYYWRAWAMAGDTGGPVSETYSFYTDIEGTCQKLEEPIPEEINKIPFVIPEKNLTCREGGGIAYREVDYALENESYQLQAISQDLTHGQIIGPKWEILCWIPIGPEWAQILHGEQEISPQELPEGLVPIASYPPLPIDTPTPTPEPQPDIPEPSPPECNDGIDNDGDSLIDLNDRECSDTNDNDESVP